ncbi:MAG: sensor histidine kinase, partial [Lachnospiraceae bacterium]|nr:sensor histidine kinase [Lachnospiraceae bacterium]
EYSVAFSLGPMDSPEDMLEEEYQKLLSILFEEKLRQENGALEMQREMREYYAMWVHQIKTPISALKLLLQEKGPVGEMEEELRELFFIEQYVEMVLSYARLESESTDFVMSSVELDEVLRNSVRKYARMFVHKKISLEYEGTSEVVLSDKKWLQFVTEQILSNAIKYTSKGKINISVKKEGTKHIFLVIADTGIGIREEDLPRICEKGYTGYNGHAHRRSTGIGLYLVNRIRKKLGHSLSIYSREGEGTEVVIGFVLADTEE